MNTYYLKILLFTILMDTLILPQYEKFVNNHYNISLIQNTTQRTIIKSRLLAQTQNHNPHYHNDPELKEMIDKFNEEAIKKFQQTHEPYKQLKELVEKNGTKLTGGNDAEPMSTIEKELLETYEEVFGEGNHIMLKSGIYPNYDDKSNDKYDKSCECPNKNKSYNILTSSNKVHDKYLDNLKTGCVGSVGVCALSCAATQFAGNVAAASSAYGVLASSHTASLGALTKALAGVSLFSKSAIKTATATVAGFTSSNIETIALAASQTFAPYIIPIIVPIIIAFVLIILYMWLYRRRKRSWKHECKKHLCK
ncbi:stevor PIR protein, putative [Plasmodium reichenowi]|uniref:Stevor PIR protein, putative n=1 Tax=Plasmodium reichenowi TaxID=5854 RepID=A0A2P9D540_PLARE|nr:stevor PIR protein, putative [Plasmodium reichenowi]